MSRLSLSLLCILIVALIPPAQADDTGHDDLKALAMQENGRSFCAPQLATLSDLQAAIDRYNRAHLELMGLLSPAQTIDALAQAYPCPAQLKSGFQAITPEQLNHLIHHGEQAFSITPIFHQLLLMRWPATFAPEARYERSEHGDYLRISLPQSESLEHWTQMLTVTGSENQARMPALSLEKLINFGIQQAASQCAGSFSFSALPLEKIAQEQVYAAVQSCGHTPDAPQSSESSLILALKGSDDIYTIRWDERGAAYDTPHAIDTQLWLQRLAQLMPVRLCALTQEKPPYPSCLQTSP